jgi:hypothetical protein
VRVLRVALAYVWNGGLFVHTAKESRSEPTRGHILGTRGHNLAESQGITANVNLQVDAGSSRRPGPVQQFNHDRRLQAPQKRSSRVMSRSRRRSRSRSFCHLPSTRFLAVTPGGGNRDFGPGGLEKTVPRTAFDSRTGEEERNRRSSHQTRYCADFLRLVHDEMLSAARASFSGWLCT